MRNGSGTSDLTFDQIRAAFDRSATLAERARRFIDQRTQQFVDRKTPKPLIHGPLCAVHLLPIAGLAGRQTFDLQSVHARTYTDFLDPSWGSGNRMFNLDGLVMYPGGVPDDGYYGYSQIFRNGTMEAASLGGGEYQPDPRMAKQLIVWAHDMTKFFRNYTSTFLDAAKSWGFVGPAVLSYALLHVEGYELGLDNSFFRRRRAEADRPHLVAPAEWIDNIEAANVDQVARPLLDTLWQAFGVERCIDFDPTTGAYLPPTR
jgi:hypothetical protein